jgi:hypothetical protein
MGDDPRSEEEEQQPAVPFAPRLLLDRLSTRTLAHLYRHSTPKVSTDEAEILAAAGQRKSKDEDDPARVALRGAVEAWMKDAGARGVVNVLTRADLKEAMAHVPIDHGQNNPNNRQVLQKRLTELLANLGAQVRTTSLSHPRVTTPLNSLAQEYARRFVHSVEVMAMLCRATCVDEVPQENYIMIIL